MWKSAATFCLKVDGALFKPDAGQSRVKANTQLTETGGNVKMTLKDKTDIIVLQ